MDLWIKDGVKLLLLLSEVGYLVGPDAFVRLFLQIKTRIVKAISEASTGEGVTPRICYPLIAVSVNVSLYIFVVHLYNNGL